MLSEARTVRSSVISAQQRQGENSRNHGRLWLRQIVINTAENTLDLKGSALVPEAVPEFLEVLSEEPAFSGREFKTFGLKLGSDEAPVINFILSTEEGQEL